MTFADLRLAEPLLRAVTTEGYTTPTPIQLQAIPHVLAARDLLGCAQTGTGKTAAFALPILHRLAKYTNTQTSPESPPATGCLSASASPTPKSPSTHSAPGATRKIRALILAPTRELAAQIADSFYHYGRHTGLRHTVIFGGVSDRPQIKALRAGVDILVATPGRLLDLIQQGFVHLKAVEILVLDEADRMLDMGFIQPIRRIVSLLPAHRQTLMFSATMPREIRHLADALLTNPAEIQVAPASAPADNVDHFVYHVAKCDKSALLRHLLQSSSMPRTLVFTRTKHGADHVVKSLRASGFTAEAIHGGKKQNTRQRVLQSFKSDNPPILVATDVASRGLDIDDISHIVNYDIPNEPETYVHRIGRTARAGASGIAFSFCDPIERSDLKAIERLIRQPIPTRTDPSARPSPKTSEKSATLPRSAVQFHPRGNNGHAPTHAPQHAPNHAPRHTPQHAAKHAPARHPVRQAAASATSHHPHAPKHPGQRRSPWSKQHHRASAKGKHRRF